MTCNYQWLPSLNIIRASSWWDDWVPRTLCLWEVKRHRDKGEDLTQEAGPGHAWDTLAGALVGASTGRDGVAHWRADIGVKAPTPSCLWFNQSI